MTTVYERVKAVVVDTLAVKEASVQEETSFEDLKADSLDLVEMIMALEKEFSTEDGNMEISDDEASDLKTVAQVVTWLEKHGVKDV